MNRPVTYDHSLNGPAGEGNSLFLLEQGLEKLSGGQLLCLL